MVIVSSRTDQGVHALRNAVHFDLEHRFVVIYRVCVYFFRGGVGLQEKASDIKVYHDNLEYITVLVTRWASC